MMRQVLLLLSVMLLGASAFAGSMYKWKDAEGNIHFTQKPPPAGVEAADKMQTNSNNSVESRWSGGMKQNAKNFMNNAGVRRVWIDRNGNEVKSRNKY